MLRSTSQSINENPPCSNCGCKWRDWKRELGDKANLCPVCGCDFNQDLDLMNQINQVDDQKIQKLHSTKKTWTNQIEMKIELTKTQSVAQKFSETDKYFQIYVAEQQVYNHAKDLLQKLIQKTPIIKAKLKKRGNYSIANKCDPRYHLQKRDCQLLISENKLQYKRNKSPIDLTDIDDIYPINCKNKYYEFHIKQSSKKRIWEFRANDKNQRNEWIKTIKLMRNRLQLKLTDLVDITKSCNNNIWDDYTKLKESVPNLNNQVKCNLTDCRSFRRYTRDREKEPLSNTKFVEEMYSTNDVNELCLIGLFDSAHCFLSHKNDVDMKSQNPVNIHGMNGYPDPSNDHYMIYREGIQMIYNTEYPTYSCLKIEIMLQNISEKEWEVDLQHAKELLTTSVAKSSESNTTNYGYGIRMTDRIGIEHLMAIQCYTNYDTLCRNFRKSFREKDSNFNDHDAIRKYHFEHYYWMGRFLYEGIEFFGKKEEQPSSLRMYVGINKRVIVSTSALVFYQPTSATDEFDTARGFAIDKHNARGCILEFSALYNIDMEQNQTRSYPVDYISLYKENEYLFFGYINNILLKSIWIWTFDNKTQNSIWNSLEFEITALNYFCKITMGFAGNDTFNISITDKKRKSIQQFLAMLCEFKVNKQKQLCQIQDDKLQYIQRLFNHYLDTKTNVQFTNIQTETINNKLGKYLLKNSDVKPHEWVICPTKIKLLFPNLIEYKDQNGNTVELFNNDIVV